MGIAKETCKLKKLKKVLFHVSSVLSDKKLVSQETCRKLRFVTMCYEWSTSDDAEQDAFGRSKRDTLLNNCSKTSLPLEG